MPKGKGYGKNSNANMGRSDTDSGSMGSNKGATSGLKVTPPGSGLRSDTKKQPSTTNRYPNGLA